MSDTMPVRAKCDHGRYDSHVHWPYKWCSGGKEITLRVWSGYEVDLEADDVVNVWVEAADG